MSIGEPLIDSSICSSGGVGPLLGSGPRARTSWQLPKGQRHLHHCFVNNLVLTQYSAHSRFQWIRFFLPIVFFFFPFSPSTDSFCYLMHIKIFSGIIYLHNHSRSKLVALLGGFILIFENGGWAWCRFQMVYRDYYLIWLRFYSCTFCFCCTSIHPWW